MKSCRPLRPGLLPATNLLHHLFKWVPNFSILYTPGFFFFLFPFNSKICWGKKYVLLKGGGGRIPPTSLLLLLTRRTAERQLHEDISSFYFCDSVFIVLRQHVGSFHFVNIAKQRLLHKWLSRQAIRKLYQWCSHSLGDRVLLQLTGFESCHVQGMLFSLAIALVPSPVKWGAHSICLRLF